MQCSNLVWMAPGNSQCDRPSCLRLRNRWNSSVFTIFWINSGNSILPWIGSMWICDIMVDAVVLLLRKIQNISKMFTRNFHFLQLFCRRKKYKLNASYIVWSHQCLLSQPLKITDQFVSILCIVLCTNNTTGFSDLFIWMLKIQLTKLKRAHNTFYTRCCRPLCKCACLYVYARFCFRMVVTMVPMIGVKLWLHLNQFNIFVSVPSAAISKCTSALDDDDDRQQSGNTNDNVFPLILLRLCM